MDLYQKTSEAVKAGRVYNLGHLHKAWGDQRRRRLMANELVYSPSPKVLKAVKDFANKLNYYAEDASTNTALKAKLASYVGLKDGADWITLGNGSMEIIDMLLRTFVDDGDEVLLPTPEYSPYVYRSVLAGGCVVDVIPAQDFSYTVESFIKLLTPRSKLIILSRPNNPTGYLIAREEIAALCATERIVWVDEAYAEFAEETVCDMLAEHPNLIVTRTFSKAIGLAGLRLGYIVANPEVISYVERVRVPCNVNLLAQIAADAALDDRAHININTRRIIQEREFLYKELAKLPGIKPFLSAGNFVLINCAATGKPASEYCARLFEAGYIVRKFAQARGLPGDEYFRVTIGSHDDMEGVLKEIRALVEEALN